MSFDLHDDAAKAATGPGEHATSAFFRDAVRLATRSPGQDMADHGILAAVAAWRERRYIGGVCRDMLRLHGDTASRHPGLIGLALYKRILASRHGCDEHLADAMLAGASQSFAEWPTSRPLNFRDVVHYVAVLDLLASNKGVRWLHSDLRRLVSEVIPKAL